MAKDDVIELPAQVPRKRRALEAVPDMWLAVWANDDTLSPGDLKRAVGERQRRKRLRPDRVAGLVVEPEGVTPEQLAGIRAILERTQPTAIVQTYVPTKVHTVSKSVAVPITVLPDRREVVKQADVVIACPRTANPISEGVWELIRYARHRSTEVSIITPDWSES